MYVFIQTSTIIYTLKYHIHFNKIQTNYCKKVESTQNKLTDKQRKRWLWEVSKTVESYYTFVKYSPKRWKQNYYFTKHNTLNNSEKWKLLLTVLMRLGGREEYSPNLASLIKVFSIYHLIDKPFMLTSRQTVSDTNHTIEINLLLKI